MRITKLLLQKVNELENRIEKQKEVIDLLMDFLGVKVETKKEIETIPSMLSLGSSELFTKEKDFIKYTKVLVKNEKQTPKTKNS